MTVPSTTASSSPSTLQRLRTIWWAIHHWIALLLCVLLVPIAISGAVLVWHDELEPLLHPARFAVTGNATAEQILLRSRWESTGAGRSDGYVTGGDLGDLVATASECWDTGFSAVFHEDSWSDSTGDEAQCVYADPEYADDPDVIE